METAIFTERLAFLADDADCRTVLDACVQALGGTIFQRDGAWQIRSINESNDGAPGRVYGPGGTYLGELNTTPTPAFTIKPERLAVAGDVYWIDASQRIQRRAGWKSLTATGDAAFAENVFRQGEYFSLREAWTEVGTSLQQQAGWEARRPNTTDPASTFP
jgi:hypothetical protein